MKISTFSLLLVFVLGLDANVHSQGQSSCNYFTYQSDPSWSKLESFGVLQAVAFAGPNGEIPYTPPVPGTPLASLGYSFPLNPSGNNTITQQFDVNKPDAHSNDNGAASAHSILKYIQEIEAGPCNLYIHCQLSKTFSGAASINQAHCPPSPPPQPTASANASGSVFNVISLPFIARESGDYCLSGKADNAGCVGAPLGSIQGTAKIYDSAGQVLASIQVSQNPYLVSIDSAPVHLVAGNAYQLLYVWDDEDALKEVKATCAQPKDSAGCSKVAYFNVRIDKNSNCDGSH